MPATVSVTPEVRASACGSAAFAPVSRTVDVVVPGANAVNFDYQATVTGQYTIGVNELFATGFLSQLALRLNNDRGQSSYMSVGAATLAFDTPVVTIGLPWPLGSGQYFVRDMNLDGAAMSHTGSAFNLALHFEEAGIELKGIHKTLGDVGLPDFQMSNTTLNAAAMLQVRNGRLLF